MLLRADHGNCFGLVLLDLSAAFDTLDHVILLKCLELCVGVNEVALVLLHGGENIRSKYWKPLFFFGSYNLLGTSGLYSRAATFLPLHVAIGLHV